MTKVLIHLFRFSQVSLGVFFWTLLPLCSEVIKLYGVGPCVSSPLTCFIGKLGVKQQLLVYGCISVCLCRRVCIISSQIKSFPKRLCHIRTLINVFFYFIFWRDTNVLVALMFIWTSTVGVQSAGALSEMTWPSYCTEERKCLISW